MNARTVFVILLNHNGWQDSIGCIQSLLQLSYPNYRIVVVDNGSTDGSLENIKAWAAGELPVEPSCSSYDASTKHVRWIEYDRASAESGGLSELETKIGSLHSNQRMVLIQTGANLGYAGGNNVGIRYATSRGFDYVWILNNDTEVHPNSLTRLIERAEEDESIGISGSTLLYYHDRTRVQALGGARYNKWLGVAKHIGEGEVWEQIRGAIDRDAVERQMDYVVGASMLVSRKFIETVGLMCEEYFLYYEELDWAIRGKKHGFRLAWAPDSIVYHKEGATTGGDPDPRQRSLQADYWSNRNRVYFTYKFYPYALPTVYLGLLGAIFNRVRRRQFNHAEMIIETICLGSRASRRLRNSG